MAEFPLTLLWTALNYLGVILLYDGFSKRRHGADRFLAVGLGYVVVKSLILSTPFVGVNDFFKIPLSIFMYALFHLSQYTVNGVFTIYIAVIYYSITCCTENLVFTAGLLEYGLLKTVTDYANFFLSLISYLLVIFICNALKMQRVKERAKIRPWQWYSVPAVLSLLTTLLVFYFGACYREGKISVMPLFACALFLTIVQVAALFLVSWMEMNAHFREEMLCLHTQSQAQQESIEALSLAYAQQRKLTHDFNSHINVIHELLSQDRVTQEDVKRYVRDLQKAQTDRIFLVSTHHIALDALLNQKASVAAHRDIDIQFSVNDLSPLKINIVDLTIIISNILDNAIEACEKLPETERQIFVKVLLEENELFFSVRNRSLPVTMLSGQLPASTKANGILHGYGLENVRTTVAKYKAIYSINYQDGWFHFATELPNTLIS